MGSGIVGGEGFRRVGKGFCRGKERGDGEKEGSEGKHAKGFSPFRDNGNIGRRGVEAERPHCGTAVETVN